MENEFNCDPNKQTQDVIIKINHPPLLFNQNLVESSPTQKHLRMVLDTKLDFNLHLKMYKAK